MRSETRVCQNCRQQFVIEPEDFNFYEKIKVPPPTFCPECRMQRRLAWRNERRLYRRECDLCHAQTIGMYPPETPFPVYCRECWWSDRWDPMSHGQEYDFSRPFFEQFLEMMNRVPHLNVINTSNNINCDYTSWLDESKNCYLLFGSTKCEDVMYGELLYECKNSLDMTNCNSMELSYQCVNSKKCYRCVWSVNCVNCTDCLFCFDCRSSNNCFLSWNLRNKSYCILNEQHSREAWTKRVEEIMGSHLKMEEALTKFQELLRGKTLHRFANFVQCVNSTGNDLIESKNARYCYDSSKIEDCKYIAYGDVIKDCVDYYAIVEKSELCYEGISTRITTNAAFVMGGWGDNYNIRLSQYVVGSHDLLGCYALRKKEYCILNKQYSKAEYDSLAAKVIEDMSRRGEYGEFFPIQISPFGYNETIANDYFPLSQEEAGRRGYPWQARETGQKGKQTIEFSSFPDRIEDVDEGVVNGILACEQCGRNFRIMQRELDFYRALRLPVPRKCADCRYYRRLTFRNPRKLWHRKCTCAGEKSENGAYQNTVSHFHDANHCPNEFETSYASDRPEIVYCEQCYQAEVV